MSAVAVLDVLSDKKQVLFRQCQMENCVSPVIPVADKEHCWLHEPVQNKHLWPLEVGKAQGSES